MKKQNQIYKIHRTYVILSSKQAEARTRDIRNILVNALLLNTNNCKGEVNGKKDQKRKSKKILAHL